MTGVRFIDTLGTMPLPVFNREIDKFLRRYIMDFAAIRNAAEAYKPAMVKFLRDMIAIPSESCE